MKLKKILVCGVAALCFTSVGLGGLLPIVSGNNVGIVRADSSLDYAKAFSERMYTIVLGRGSDPTGINYWSSRLVAGEISGAECAQGFFFSDEFINKNISDDEYINILYRAILGREADNTGRSYWTNWMHDGMTRACVLDGFVRSTEFNEICARYNLTAGSITLTTAMDTHPYANAFVADIYRNFLNREPDPTGWNSWVTMLTEKRITAADFLEGVIYSNEFTGMGVSDHDYIAILYRGILGRTAGEAEIQSWLSTGNSRPLILRGVVQSPEFTAKCEVAGVNRGNIDVNSYIELSEIGRGFATRMYPLIMGRQIDKGSADNWASLVGNGSTAAEIVGVLYNSQEFANRNLSDSDFINNVYSAVLGRSASAAEVDNWINMMNTSNVSRAYIVKSLVNSAEFASICETYGIPVGSYTTTDPRDINPLINDYIINAYSNMLGVNPNNDEISHWAGTLASLDNTGSGFISALSTDSRFTSNSVQNQVTKVYLAALGRNPSSSELSAAVNTANANGISAVINSITGSQEFDSVCSAHGISATLVRGWNNTVNGRIYFDGSTLYAGWQRIDGNRYYFDPTTNVAASGWVFIDGLKYYFDPNNNVLIQDVDNIIGHRDSYYLTVNCETNIVMVYAQDVPGGAYNIPVRAMACSSGRDGTNTVQGDFTLRRQNRWQPMNGGVYAQFVTVISGNYLFHSSWYYEMGNNHSLSVRQYNMLGQDASHGCVRLTTADAIWIYNNCNGSSVHVYTANDTAPFDKPVTPRAVVISGDYGYDPTDPYA